MAGVVHIGGDQGLHGVDGDRSDIGYFCELLDQIQPDAGRLDLIAVTDKQTAGYTGAGAWDGDEIGSAPGCVEHFVRINGGQPDMHLDIIVLGADIDRCAARDYAPEYGGCVGSPEVICLIERDLVG